MLLDIIEIKNFINSFSILYFKIPHLILNFNFNSNY